MVSDSSGPLAPKFAGASQRLCTGLVAPKREVDKGGIFRCVLARSEWALSNDVEEGHREGAGACSRDFDHRGGLKQGLLVEWVH